MHYRSLHDPEIECESLMDICKTRGCPHKKHHEIAQLDNGGCCEASDSVAYFLGPARNGKSTLRANEVKKLRLVWPNSFIFIVQTSIFTRGKDGDQVKALYCHTKLQNLQQLCRSSTVAWVPSDICENNSTVPSCCKTLNKPDETLR